MPASTIELEPMIRTLVLAATRISGLMLFCPVLSSPAVPGKVKAGLTLWLTALLYPACSAPGTALAGGWGFALGKELLAGLLLGMTASFVLEAASFAGQLAGMQMGFSLVNVLDPTSEVETPVLSSFYQWIVILILLRLNVHHWFVRGLAASFRYLPLGGTRSPDAGLLHAASAIWLAGVQLAVPILVATVLVDLALGFVGKASPQLPVMIFGLSIKSMVGMVLLMSTLALWPSYIEKQFAVTVASGERLLRLGE